MQAGLPGQTLIRRLNRHKTITKGDVRMRRGISITLFTIMALFALHIGPAAAATPVTGKVIMIDAGHGGFDPGAINPRTEAAEKWINLAVVHRLKDKLELDGAKVLLTRIDDRFLSLSERADLANMLRPEVFISVHHNSAASPISNGTETYWTHSSSYALADSLNANLVSNMQTANRGAQNRNLAVTRLTNMPAALTEASFITSDAESSAFINLDRVEQEATGLQQGLLNYFSNRG